MKFTHHTIKFHIYDINSGMEGGYTEYGYRGLEEIKRLVKVIEEKDLEIKRKNELLDELSKKLRESNGRIKH